MAEQLSSSTSTSPIEANNDNISDNNNNHKDNKNKENKENVIDPELFSCMLQPATADSDPDYIGVRRLLLFRKAESGVRRRLAKKLGIANTKLPEYSWKQVAEILLDDGRWLPSSSPLSLLYEVDSWSSSRDLRSGNLASSHRTSFSSTASDSDQPRRQGPEPAYSFVGMHCIFDQCKAAVTILKFGHMSSDLLAYGASDGTLTVCTVSDPPKVIKLLNGHSKDVTANTFSDFDFSSNNQYIASSSMDKTVRVFNFSTGRIIKKLVVDSEVTSMDHDHTGQLLFCGDAQGCIYSISMESHSGALSRSHRHRTTGKRKCPVTTVQYRSFSLLAGGPVLLTCTQDGNLSFFSVALEIQGYLTFRCSLKLAPRVHSIRASFCPLLSLEKGEYIVAGSEDSNVYFYDLAKPKHSCVNKLQGHRFPVVAVAWNHGENLLASSDLYGIVIVWKRAKTS
ncbi:wd repeat-containing protein 13 [Citrus sinensis]|uniref:Wd repeat-containing protein 13 n=1 Tax=Citrus sinensis TaxID=2711 RepID=A0ACB8IHB5_CITSI|nr:wd repeat-containing protein 13 [Citrus sinensis]